MVEIVFSSLINGVSYGLLLFMLASGLTLIFSMMGVLNFAHGGMFMLGSYLSYQFGLLFGFLPALLLAPALVGAIGMVVERYGLRFVHRHGHVPELLLTFGLTYVIHEVVVMIWGRYPVQNQPPAFLEAPLFTLFNTTYPTYRVFVTVISVGLFTSLWAVLRFSRIGIVVRAALTHPRMVTMLGHDVDRLFMFLFGAGCAMAGLAGAIGGYAFITEPNMAASIGPIIFVVIVVGGLGSLPGALIAALVIGIVQTFAVAINISVGDIISWLGVATEGSDPSGMAGITVARLAPLIPYVLLIATLVFRPQGIMGQRES